MTLDSHKVVEHIEKVWGLCPGNTKIVALSEGTEADGSQMFLQSLKNKFEAPGWTEANFINTLPVGMHKAVNGDNLVLVDDFIGTGSTAERKVKWLSNKLAERGIQNVKTYLVTTAGMKFARSRLDNLEIEYYSPSWLKKGISDRFDGYERSDAIAWMKHLEHKLAKCKKQEECVYTLGFGGSESLYAIEAFNVPDNVFPVFWWPTLANGQARRPLFRRLKTR
jgi:hypothetical protein